MELFASSLLYNKISHGFSQRFQRISNMAFLCVFFDNFEYLLQKCDIPYDSS
jgi:hypothetical protein